MSLKENQVKAKEFNLLESIVSTAIILAVAHTFLEDLAVLAGWNKSVQSVLAVIGFGFDLFFTIEFLVRLYLSINEKKARQYLLHEKGWVDFLAAVPVLMFNSGPLFAAGLSGKFVSPVFGAVLNMLKLAKAIRIVRILRLLRLLKIFRNFKYTDSKMAQRHVAKIITIAVATTVFTLFVMDIFSSSLDFSGTRRDREQQKERMISLINSNKRSESRIFAVLNGINELKEHNNVLVIKISGRTIYSRFSQKYYDTEVGYDDYDYASADNTEIFFDLRNSNMLQARNQAKDNMIFFFIAIMLVVACLVIYCPHFILTIANPVYFMRRGFKESGYNFNVKIPERYSDDDVYRLAALYNEIYLPFKEVNFSGNNENGNDEG